MTKTYKILIDKVVAQSTAPLEASLLQIKQKSGKIHATCPFAKISKTAFSLQAKQQITLLFTLLELSTLGSRVPRPFADGSINVPQTQFQRNPTVAMGCTLKNIVNKSTVLSLVVVLKEDEERVNCSVPDSDQSFIQEVSEEDSETELTKSEVIPKPEIKLSPTKPTLSPVKKFNKKMPRTRHFEYCIKDETSNFQIKNKVTYQQSNYVQNLRIDLDEALSSIQFFGKKHDEMLASVKFQTNPTEDQIKQLKIKIPQSEKALDIYLKTLQGHKLHGRANLPELDEKECLKIQCNFKDENDEVKAKMKFNFKQNQQQNNANNKVVSGKMQMGQEVNIFHNLKMKEHQNYRSFLFSDSNKFVESPRLKLPKINEKEHLSSQILQKKDHFAIEQTLSKSKQTISRTRNETEPQQNRNQSQIRIRRSKTIQSKEIPSYQKQYSYADQKNTVIKVNGVSIKFYKSYLDKEDILEPQVFSAKSLFIYVNASNIFRSDPTFQTKNLNWSLKNCELSINSFENITFQLTLQKQKLVIGQLIVSYNQLKFNQEQNSLYFGYLTKKHNVIAKVCVDFQLIDATRNITTRNSTLDKTSRLSRKKRIYSEQIFLTENEERKESPSKTNLYVSMGTPLDLHRKKMSKLVKNQSLQEYETEVMRDRKKSQVVSPRKKQRFF